jgi:hypothetical protein
MATSFVVAAVGDTVVQARLILTQASDDEIARQLARDGLVFDAAYTYRRLVEYLDTQIRRAEEDAVVDVIEAVRYDAESSNDRVKQTVDEILAIHGAGTAPIGRA